MGDDIAGCGTTHGGESYARHRAAGSFDDSDTRGSERFFTIRRAQTNIVALRVSLVDYVMID